MLKKKIATTVTAVTRLCTCGEIVTVAATDEQTICKCGKVVYSVKNDNGINGEIAHEEAKFKTGNSSTKSTDSE